MPVFTADEVKKLVDTQNAAAKAAIEGVKPERLGDRYVSLLATDLLAITEAAKGNKTPAVPGALS